VFSDSQFLLYDNSDTSRNLAFDLGSITTGTVRTLTAPNASGRIQVEGQPIGNTTPAAGTFTTLASSSDATLNGFVIGASSIAPTSGSRNYQTNSGEGLVAVVSGAALAAGTNAARFAAFSNNRCGMRPEGELGWASSGAPSSSNFDLILRRDAAGVLSQYNAANPQEYRIFNTFTSATNHERGFLRWSSNVFQIGTEKGSGGGTARALEFQTDGVTRVSVAANGPLTVSAGATFTGGVTAATVSCRQANGGISFGDGFTFITGPSTAGVLTISAFNSSDVLVRLGGTSSSWPALNTSGSTLRIRLADNSGFAPLSCGALTLNGNLDASTRNIVTDTTTGTRIGTGTTQLLGFWNATPAAQPAAVADATDAASTQARLNDLLARLRTLGLIAT
jgi:hypothetical protein